MPNRISAGTDGTLNFVRPGPRPEVCVLILDQDSDLVGERMGQSRRLWVEFGQDDRIVLTLDAGGTNFAFSAWCQGNEVVVPFTLPSYGDDLPRCLETLMTGFDRAKKEAGGAAAISFAFPGPSDYPNGIIGDLVNLPGFRGGVALGPLLEHRFGVPVFINNDGDLFTYGEAMAGLLPEVNRRLEASGSPKRFQNLFGLTLGTGLGGGLVTAGHLFRGDNSAGGEVWAMRNRLDREASAEEGASIRGVRRAFSEAAGVPLDQVPEPKAIFEIGIGQRPGNANAAREAFRKLGVVAGDALANANTLVDALVVVGGGLSGAAPLFLSALVAEMNAALQTPDGREAARTEVRAFNLEDGHDLDVFLLGDVRHIEVPGTQQRVPFDAMKRTGVGLSRLGTSRATALGAYAFALQALPA